MEPAPDSATGEDSAPGFAPALIGEASRKAGLVWLSYPDPNGSTSPRPAWHVWVDGAAYVVTGGGEQDLPGLADTREVTVVVPSKDTRARIVTWLGRVRVVAKTDEAWVAATSALASKRLNAEGGVAMIDRWARESMVVEITPTGQVIDTAEDPSPASLAEPPRATTATTLGRQPYMLGGLRRHRR